jgi:hypothetical protein
MISWRHRNDAADRWKIFIDRKYFYFAFLFCCASHREKKFGRICQRTIICQRTMMDHSRRLTGPVNVIPPGDTTYGAISMNFFELSSN